MSTVATVNYFLDKGENDNDVDHNEMKEVYEEYDDDDEEEENGSYESEDPLENDINCSKSDNDLDEDNKITGEYSEQFSEDENEIERGEKKEIGDDGYASKESENFGGFEKFFDGNESNEDDQANKYNEGEDSEEDEGSEGDNEIETEGDDGDEALGGTLATYLGLLRSADEDAQNILRNSGTKVTGNFTARGDYVLEDNGFSPVKTTGKGAIAADNYGSGNDYDDMVNENCNSDDDNSSGNFNKTDDNLIVI
jgi:hypothetical protein